MRKHPSQTYLQILNTLILIKVNQLEENYDQEMLLNYFI